MPALLMLQLEQAYLIEKSMAFKKKKDACQKKN
jgi:hypothetical protein